MMKTKAKTNKKQVGNKLRQNKVVQHWAIERGHSWDSQDKLPFGNWEFWSDPKFCDKNVKVSLMQINIFLYHWKRFENINIKNEFAFSI